jgi:uncharacterized membrane protein YeaQ/YmgE (transglycosylase-associated protein family)
LAANYAASHSSRAAITSSLRTIVLACSIVVHERPACGGNAFSLLFCRSYGPGPQVAFVHLGATVAVSHTKDINMSIIGWILLGLIAGFIASKIVNKSGDGFILDVVLGIVGAVVGGFIFNMIGAAGVTGFNIWSMFVAVIGAIVVLAGYHALRGRRALG